MKLRLATLLSERATHLSRCVGVAGSTWAGSTWARTCWLAVGLLLAACIEPEPIAAQAVPGAHYQVRVSDYYGQLKTEGYVPLRFTITRFGPAVNVAETLYVGVEASTYSYYRSLREFSAQVDFKAGQVTATVEINAEFSSGNRIYAVVSRDGAISTVPRQGLVATMNLPDWLSSDNWSGPQNSVIESIGIAYFTSQIVFDTGVHIDTYSNPDWDNNRTIETGPSVAANVTAAIPNFEHFTSVNGRQTHRLEHSNTPLPTVTDSQISHAVNNRFVVAGDFSAIPETWLGLSRVDVCLMSVEDLRLLANQRPEKLEVIRQWVVAGGRLVVLNCQFDFSALGSIVPNLTSASESTKEIGPAQWTMLEEASADHLLAQYDQQVGRWKADMAERSQQSSYQVTTIGNPIISWIEDRSLDKRTKTFVGTTAKVAEEATAANAWCLSTVFGLGRIVALPSDGRLKQDDWLKLLLLAFGNQESTCFDGIGERNHQFHGYDGFDYKRLGKPPWLLFLVMITLFGLLVGPVAFVVLTRLQRTHLLLGAVPLIAGVITFGIVGYALIQDGFAFRTSRYSVTWLDTTHQTALTQTTQMVYSGVAPGSLQVPRSTAYYDNTNDTTRNRHSQLRLFLQDDQQIISGAKIQARTKAQVTTFDVQAAPGQVLLSASVDGSKWEATNELGFDIERLVMQTPSGPMMAEDVGMGATVVLENDSGDKSPWFNEFRRRKHETQAAIPDLLHEPQHLYMDRLSSASRMVFDSNKIPPGMFLAISNQQPLARNLRENSFQEEELHVTIGQFRATTRLPEAGPPTEADASADAKADENTDVRTDERGETSTEGAGDE